MLETALVMGLPRVGEPFVALRLGLLQSEQPPPGRRKVAVLLAFLRSPAASCPPSEYVLEDAIRLGGYHVAEFLTTTFKISHSLPEERPGRDELLQPVVYVLWGDFQTGGKLSRAEPP